MTRNGLSMAHLAIWGKCDNGSSLAAFPGGSSLICVHTYRTVHALDDAVVVAMQDRSGLLMLPNVAINATQPSTGDAVFSVLGSASVSRGPVLLQNGLLAQAGEASSLSRPGLPGQQDAVRVERALTVLAHRLHCNVAQPGEQKPSPLGVGLHYCPPTLHKEERTPGPGGTVALIPEASGRTGAFHTPEGSAENRCFHRLRERFNCFNTFKPPDVWRRHSHDRRSHGGKIARPVFGFIPTPLCHDDVNQGCLWCSYRRKDALGLSRLKC
ncbi:hypothetical protein B0T21DRAFT_346940 [Apiosordaria backusii]|uniref:Uncharacterized protein n=1 Tax=Apiosordaria backusii TaxID=314023 RepID=A0AA40BST8_9PEZI|nr:hypothetical protein B0T21DRAFT_346940 [Apiosordaria backusii]